MTRATSRIAAILLAAGLLSSCGGGGGEDGGGRSDKPQLSASTTTVSVSAQPGEAAPQFTVVVRIDNPPSSGLWATYDYTTNGVEDVGFDTNSAPQISLPIQFRSPNDIPNDHYEDTITLHVCTDQFCEDDIDGSPATIRVAYDVAGGIRATLSREQIDSQADGRDTTVHQEAVELTTDRPLEEGAAVRVTYTQQAIAFVDTEALSATQTRIRIYYKLGSKLDFGMHDDRITLKVCYDLDCYKELLGSPLRIYTHHDVTIDPEPGFESLEVASRTALGHDVLDAEFSRALNRIVMVSGKPVNALYVYDVTTGTESQQLLDYEPRAVSIAPDGLSAAVGHFSRISVIDLTQVGDAGAPAPIVLNIDSPVFDLVLDGSGKVHVTSELLDREPPRSVDIATNTLTIGTGLMTSRTRARLNPSATSFYDAHPTFSPTRTAKWDISSGTATYLYDSWKDQTVYDVCGNVWFNNAGSLLYTACGTVFTSSVVREDDLLYVGALELTNDSTVGDHSHVIRSLSESAARDEIAVVEVLKECELPVFEGTCYTHLALYDAATRTRRALFAIQPVTEGDVTYAQLGYHVFHDAVNGRMYLISRLERKSRAEAFYLSVIE